MVLFYKDYFGKGGAPSEIRTFIEFARKNGQSIDIIYSYRALLNYILKNRGKSEIVFAGFFFSPYPLFWLLLSVLRVKYTIWPLAHISTYSMDKKLFTVTPIISELNEHGKFHKDQRSYAKPIFMFCAQILFKCNQPKFWVFSNFEHSQVKHYFGEVEFRLVYWVCGDNIKHYDDTALDTHLSDAHPEKKVLLCWSRIDVHNKGLDRFHELTQVLSKEKDEWLSITCGPYYAGDISNIPSSENWLLLDTTKPSPYDVQFMMADFIVLLSRWDGFPRVLREAVFHQKPMIVSQETHFRDLVEEFGLGVVFRGDYQALAESIQEYDVGSGDFSGALQRINDSFTL